MRQYLEEEEKKEEKKKEKKKTFRTTENMPYLKELNSLFDSVGKMGKKKEKKRTIINTIIEH